MDRIEGKLILGSIKLAIRFALNCVIPVVAVSILYMILSAFKCVGNIDSYIVPGQIFQGALKFMNPVHGIGIWNVLDDVFTGINASQLSASAFQGSLYEEITFGLLVIAIQRPFNKINNLLFKRFFDHGMIADAICAVPSILIAIIGTEMVMDVLVPILNLGEGRLDFLVILVGLVALTVVTFCIRGVKNSSLLKSVVDIFVDVILLILLYATIMSGAMLTNAAYLNNGELFGVVLMFIFSLLGFVVLESLRFSGSIAKEFEQ